MTQPKYSKTQVPKCQNQRNKYEQKKKFFGVMVRSDGVLKTINEREQLSKRHTNGTHRDILKVPKYAF
jgi:hypothetical protein